MGAEPKKEKMSTTEETNELTTTTTTTTTAEPKKEKISTTEETNESTTTTTKTTEPKKEKSWVCETFGDVLLSKNDQGETVEGNTSTLLDDKYVGIYFSAHWCPPCRGFTPVLAESYNAYLGADKTDFEIVFVSSDQDENAFMGYFGEMPWKALPFSLRDKKKALSDKYGVRGIPTFVLLDKDGSTITKDGRSNVMSDKTFSKFPYLLHVKVHMMHMFLYPMTKNLRYVVSQ